jgi:hypothetical protein
MSDVATRIQKVNQLIKIKIIKLIVGWMLWVDQPYLYFFSGGHFTGYVPGLKKTI